MDERKKAIDFILADGNLDYHCLDDDVSKHPNEIDWLLYSCILYEQAKGRIREDADTFLAFWKKEKETGERLKAVKRLHMDKGFSAWPDYIAIECTTACPAKCTNCTHESLIMSGQRKIGDISYEEACYRIRKVKLYTLLFEVEHPKFGPVGLGEPFCHPQMLEILQYAAAFFDHVEITTNARLLSRDKAEKLAQLPMAMVSISLSYFDKVVYEREIGMDYDTVVQNIVYYFEQRKRFNSSGFVVLHIFDNSLSTKNDYQDFVRFFNRYTREGDVLNHRVYYEFVQNHIKTNQKDIELKPCGELWHIMAVDVDGYIYPCCMGLWEKYDASLALGKMEAPIQSVVQKIISIRSQQFIGLSGRCRICPSIRHYTEFLFPIWMYHRQKCVQGPITLGYAGRIYTTSQHYCQYGKEQYLKSKGWAVNYYAAGKRWIAIRLKQLFGLQK